MNCIRTKDKDYILNINYKWWYSFIGPFVYLKEFNVYDMSLCMVKKRKMKLKDIFIPLVIVVVFAVISETLEKKNLNLPIYFKLIIIIITYFISKIIAKKIWISKFDILNKESVENIKILKFNNILLKKQIFAYIFLIALFLFFQMLFIFFEKLSYFMPMAIIACFLATSLSYFIDPPFELGEIVEVEVIK